MGLLAEHLAQRSGDCLGYHGLPDARRAVEQNALGGSQLIAFIEFGVGHWQFDGFPNQCQDGFESANLIPVHARIVVKFQALNLRSRQIFLGKPRLQIHQ